MCKWSLKNSRQALQVMLLEHTQPLLNLDPHNSYPPPSLGSVPQKGNFGGLRTKKPKQVEEGGERDGYLGLDTVEAS